ncbi:hypothetical protein GQ42DRAFT_165483 [Ramicandelaber brevisporus]|nr:hypothetical protein GQ42DRAFT_165483 [Ramicandelaber brevisporus]
MAVAWDVLEEQVEVLKTTVESEHTWKQLNLAILDLSYICQPAVPYTAIEVLQICDYLQQIETPLVNCALTERSQLSGAALQCIVAIVQLLQYPTYLKGNSGIGGYCLQFCGVIVPELMKLTGRSNKLFVNRGHQALNDIVSSGAINGMIAEFAEYVRCDKNKTVRAIAASLIYSILEQVGQGSSHLIESTLNSKCSTSIEEMLMSGLVDSAPEVREASRKVLSEYVKLGNPSKVSKLIDQLPANIKKLFSKPTTSSTTQHNSRTGQQQPSIVSLKALRSAERQPSSLSSSSSSSSSTEKTDHRAASRNTNQHQQHSQPQQPRSASATQSTHHPVSHKLGSIEGRLGAPKRALTPVLPPSALEIMPERSSTPDNAGSASAARDSMSTAVKSRIRALGITGPVLRANPQPVQPVQIPATTAQQQQQHHPGLLSPGRSNSNSTSNRPSVDSQYSSASSTDSGISLRSKPSSDRLDRAASRPASRLGEPMRGLPVQPQQQPHPHSHPHPHPPRPSSACKTEAEIAAASKRAAIARRPQTPTSAASTTSSIASESDSEATEEQKKARAAERQKAALAAHKLRHRANSAATTPTLPTQMDENVKPSTKSTNKGIPLPPAASAIAATKPSSKSATSKDSSTSGNTPRYLQPTSSSRARTDVKKTSSSKSRSTSASRPETAASTTSTS